MIESATFDDWLIKYSEIYDDLARLTTTRCPNCANRGLNLVMVVREKDSQQGWAAFWCSHCMTGITTGRAAVKDGMSIYVSTSSGSIGEVIPDYEQILPV